MHDKKYLFLCEQHELSIDDAIKIYNVKTLLDSFDYKPSVFNKHGIVRVYFTIWSQNSLLPVQFLKCAYYDLKKDDIIFEFYIYCCNRIDRCNAEEVSTKFKKFSGAKTRERLKAMIRGFYESKHRN